MSKIIKTFSNNKAQFEFYDNSTVRKIFFRQEANIAEFERLKKLKDSFSVIRYENFIYSFPEIYSGDLEGGILMDFIPGKDFINLNNVSERDYFHAGLWLGYFHSLSRKGNQVQIFHDYTPHNIMISRERNLITGMDPGFKAMQWNDYYYDILVFFTSIIISFIRKKVVFNKLCVREFINGYTIYSEFKYDQNLYKRNMKYRFDQLLNNQGRKKRYSPLKRYLGYFAIRYYVNRILKPTLKEFK